MAIAEAEPFTAEHSMPPPGTLEHLDYISRLEIPQISTLQELQGFLLTHRIAESFAGAMIDSQSALGNSHISQISMDSRSVFGNSPSSPLIRGAIHTISHNPQTRLLTLHGRPNPKNSEGYDYTYDLSLPLDARYNLDLNRPPEANFARGNASTKLWDRLTYRPYAYEEYEENDPTILLYAIAEAARDMSALIKTQAADELAEAA